MAAWGLVRRSALIAMVAVTLVVASSVLPAYAQTVTTTTNTFTLRNGNTATLVRTYVDGVLSSLSYKEVAPSGLVPVTRDISYYPSGLISHFVEVRTTSTGDQTTLSQNFYSNGAVSDQYVKIVSAGQTIAEQFIKYDTSGLVLSQETRILTTLLDGTQVWMVTINLYSGGVLVSSTTRQYPFGYNFNAQKPTWPGNGNGSSAQPHSGAPGQDPNDWRPGAGGGDSNHQHYGAPGQMKKSE